MKRFALVAFCAAAAFVCGSSSADAAFKLRLVAIDGGGNEVAGTAVDYADEGLDDDADGAAGVLSVNVNFQGFTIVSELATSNRGFGYPNGPATVSNKLTVSRAGGTSAYQGVRAYVTDTDFNFPVDIGTGFIFESRLLEDSGLGSGFQSYLGLSNNEFEIDDLTTNFQSVISVNTLGVASLPALYSITNVATLNTGSLTSIFTDTVSGESSVYTPEPTSLALLGLGGLGLVGGAIRRRRRSV